MVLQKKLIKIKQLRTDTFIDDFRCQPYYQVLLVTYLKFTKKECKVCQERRKIKSVCNFIGLEINKLKCNCK